MLCKGRLPVFLRFTRSLPSYGCAGENGPLILTIGALVPGEPTPLPGPVTLLTAAPGFFTCAKAPGAAAIIRANAPPDAIVINLFRNRIMPLRFDWFVA